MGELYEFFLHGFLYGGKIKVISGVQMDLWWGVVKAFSTPFLIGVLIRELSELF
jgi:hypothetical protein